MKMRPIRFILPAAILFLAACGGQPEVKEQKAEISEGLTGTFSVDKEASNITWEGTMLEVGGVSLYGHHGNIKIAKGEVVADNGKIANGMIVVDMTTIEPTDENYQDKDGQRAKDLVGHLSSDDFFAVNEHPHSTFEIHSAEDGKVVGQMTIRGITKEVVIDEITVEDKGETMHAKGKFSFDRQDFGARFSMPVQEKVLSDKIRMGFDIVAKKNA
jgi:polyisoprenoid-binding protein YceI